MLVIRALTPQDDLPAVGELYAESWRAAYRGMLPDAFLSRLTGDRWSAVLHANMEQSLVLYEDGELLGTAMIGFSRETGQEGDGELISLYLRPGHTGRGLGRRLLEAALERLHAEGCERARLWVLSANVGAIGFYQHLGFQRTGRVQEERYGGETAELTEMSRALSHA